MNKILAYTIPLEKEFSLYLPRYAPIHTGGVKKGVAVICVQVDNKQPLVERYFIMIKTDEEIKIGGIKYVTTFHELKGKKAYHLFEKI